jgi:hypothetical protein
MQEAIGELSPEEVALSGFLAGRDASSAIETKKIVTKE